MKRWSPVAFADPGETHRNFNQSTGERGSWLDADGYQQVLDELSNLTAESGFAPSAVDSLQVAKAVRSQALNFAAFSGTANAIVVTTLLALGAHVPGMPLVGVAALTNTSGTVTAAVDGLAARAVRRTGGADLRIGDIIGGGIVVLRDNGTYYELQNPRLAGLPILQQSLTAPGTTSVAVPSTATGVRVRLWGAGGSGGSAGPNTLAAGGGGGGYAEGVYPVTPGASISATVGAGGAAPTAGNNNGNAGGTSSFGSLLSATGGLGGGAGSAIGVSGGLGVGGQLNLAGQPSGGGFAISASVFVAGAGGAAPHGGGGALYPVTANNSGLNGNAGVVPGGGGSGAASTSVWNTNMSGGAGGDGLIILEWF